MTPQAFNKAMGAVVRKERQARGWTLKVLGDHLDIAYQQVGKYEHGENGFSAHMLTCVAEIFQLPVADLLEKARINIAVIPRETPPAEHDAVLAARYIAKIPSQSLRSNLIDFAQMRLRGGQSMSIKLNELALLKAAKAQYETYRAINNEILAANLERFKELYASEKPLRAWDDLDEKSFLQALAVARSAVTAYLSSRSDGDGLSFELIKRMAQAIKEAANKKSGVTILNTDALVYAEAALWAATESEAV